MSILSSRKRTCLLLLACTNSAVFFSISQKAFEPPNQYFTLPSFVKKKEQSYSFIVNCQSLFHNLWVKFMCHFVQGHICVFCTSVNLSLVSYHFCDAKPATYVFVSCHTFLLDQSTNKRDVAPILSVSMSLLQMHRRR